VGTPGEEEAGEVWEMGAERAEGGSSEKVGTGRNRGKIT